VFAFFWNALSFPIAILVVSDVVTSGEWAGLLVLLFPLVGVGLLWAAISVTWKAWVARRRGEATDRPPGARTRPGRMADQAARAMFDPAGRSFGPARLAQDEVPIPASLAQVEEGGGGLVIRYSRRRFLGLAVMLFVVGAFFFLGGIAMFAGGGGLLGALAFIAVGVLVDLAAVANLRDGLAVTIGGGELSVEKSGLSRRQSWRVRCGSVSAIRPAISFTMMGTPYFSLVAEAGGQRIPLGNALKGVELADSVGRRIARALGAPPSIVKPAASATGEPVTA
jgi:hypothetical protein